MPSRRERRAADRRSQRDGRSREATDGAAVADWLTTRNVTIAGLVLALLAVAIVAFGQFGGREPDRFRDPGVHYAGIAIEGTALGDPAAPVTLDVYGDFQCPRCAEHASLVEPMLVSRYVRDGRLRIVHHDIAILDATADRESERAARGGFCAARQGAYWDYAHWVFANQAGENRGGFARDRLLAIATAAGLDPVAFGDCLDSPEAAEAVKATNGQAMALGINATPTMALNGTLLEPGVRPADQLGALIEAALKDTADAAASGSDSADPAGRAAAGPAS